MKILLVRLREIGDAVFTTPAIRALRIQFPDAHLAYLVEPLAAPIVQGNPCLDRVIVSPRAQGWRGFVADLTLGARLRREHYDVAIDFHGGPRASLLTWLSAAPTRIGYEVAGRAWMYTTRIARPRELRPRHSVENQWDLLTPLGVPPADRTACPVEMTTDPAAAATAARKVPVSPSGTPERIVVIHVSAGNPFRRWPIDSFADVAAALVEAGDDIRVVLTSGPSDAEAAAQVVAAVRSRVPASQAARAGAPADLSLPELRALLERAALYIGGDSGPMHVAATTSVPIVSLYGPTLPARSEPWRQHPERTIAIETSGLPCRPCDQRQCAPGDFRCLTWIRPPQVVAAALALLKRAPAAGTDLTPHR